MIDQSVEVGFSLATFRKSNQHIYARVKETATAAGVEVNQFKDDLTVRATAKDKNGSVVAEINGLPLTSIGSRGIYRGLVAKTFDPAAANEPYTITIEMERGATHCERTGRLEIVT